LKAFLQSQKGVWIFLGLVLLGVFALLYQHSIPERIILFFRHSGQGKSWNNEVDKFQNLYPSDSIKCIFLGDSQIEQCEWSELLPACRCANRGIGNESTKGLLLRLNALPESGHRKIIFLQIGVNDVLAGAHSDEILKNYNQILENLISRHYRVIPTLVFPLRYFPDKNEKISMLNSGIRDLAEKKHLDCIDLNSHFLEGNKLSKNYTTDGVHLNAAGYQIWISAIRNRLEEKKVSGSR
jgi:lysophospholipase L1-like esterase